MIIDCHYHLEPRIQSVENLILKMDQNGIEKTALMPTMWDPPPETSEYVLKLMRFLLTQRLFRGIAKKLIANFTDSGDIILPKKTVPIYPDPDNDSVAKAVDLHPDRFLGWIFVNPNGENDPVAEFNRYKDLPGYIGVKAHPFWHRYEPKALLPVAHEAQKADLPLLIHVGFDDHGDFEPLLREVPDLKLILAHAGFPGFSDTWKEIKPHPNVYLDLSADAYLNDKTTQKVIEYIGAERCLFGTDGPYGHRAGDGFFDNGFIKRRIESIIQNKSDLEKLLGKNFQQVTRIAP